MGIAAYNRGSRAIARSIARDHGQSDPYPDKPKSQPRPKDWGSKTHQKAYKYAQGLAKYYKSKNIKVTEQDIIIALYDNFKKIGKETAKKIATEVVKEILSEAKERMSGMDIQRINGVLVKAIGLFQEGEIESLSTSILYEKKTPSARKHPHAQQVRKAIKLDAVDPLVAKNIISKGLEDGTVKDDKVKVGKKSWSAAALKPSQSTMVLDKALGMALFMLKSGKVGGDLGALVSSDNQIMDGHHRWSATIFASGKKGKVGGYGANIKGAKLLRLLNILTKGAFNVRGGKAGKGSLAEFTSANVKKKLKEMSKKGIGGNFPWSAEDVNKVLTDNFGSIEKGIETMASRADMIPKKIPSWAPDRKQMPVIEPGQVPMASTALNKGQVDWQRPYAKTNNGKK